MISFTSRRSPDRPITRLVAFTVCVLALVTLARPVSACDEHRSHQPRPEFSELYVFGDSLSDTGRFFAATGYPPAPYYQGRFSNGPVWVEYLAPQLGMKYNPATNFAWAGSTTGLTNNNGPFPGLLAQFNAYVATLGHRPRVDPHALYVVFGGGNDFFTLSDGVDPAAMIDQATRNIVTIVSRLQQLGAKNILVIDLPDIGLTPYGAPNAGVATYLSAQFNDLLDARLEAAGCRDLIRVSLFDLLNALVADPAAYGFTNVTIPGILNPATASSYLFWDDVHPTTLTHSILADVIAAAIEENEPEHGPRHHDRKPVCAHR